MLSVSILKKNLTHSKKIFLRGSPGRGCGKTTTQPPQVGAFTLEHESSLTVAVCSPVSRPPSVLAHRAGGGRRASEKGVFLMAECLSRQLPGSPGAGLVNRKFPIVDTLDHQATFRSSFLLCGGRWLVVIVPVRPDWPAKPIVFGSGQSG